MAPLAEDLANRLGLKKYDTFHEVPLGAGRADLVLRGEGRLIVIEVKDRIPDWRAVAEVQFLAEASRGRLDPSVEAPEAVLVAPAFTDAVRESAKEAGVRLLEAPLANIRSVPAPGVLLTTPQAWRVVVATLRATGPVTVRDVARTSGTSLGWTSAVVRELVSRKILDEKRQMISGSVSRLLDHVASERPLNRFESGRFPTGITDWDELHLIMATQWGHLMAQAIVPGMWVCGQSAATAYTGHLLRHDRLQLYTTDNAGLREAFPAKDAPGIMIVSYRPDRRVGLDSTLQGGLPTVGPEQALLDVAGMGYAARDTAIRLVEALRA